MIKAINFSPMRHLLEASLRGAQVNNMATESYMDACDYFGENNVALQTDKNRVDDLYLNMAEDHSRSLLRWFERETSTITENCLSLNHIYDKIIKYSAWTIHSPRHIFIHWDKVTVTNEKDESIELKDLFARVPLFANGLSFDICIEHNPFTFMKTTFTKATWNKAYIHSHAYSLSYSEPFTFKHVCTGSGPINNTINELRAHSLTNKEARMLFFWELDKVAHVESLRGVPYTRISSITTSVPTKITVESGRGVNAKLALLTKTENIYPAREFLSSFIQARKIPFAFRNGRYVLGCSLVEYAVMITNYYKVWEYYNRMARENGIANSPSFLETRKYIIQNNELYNVSNNEQQLEHIPNIQPFRFNNKDYPLVIEMEETTEYCRVNLLPLDFILASIEYLLTSINIATSSPYEETTEEKGHQNFYAKHSPTISRSTRKRQAEGKTNGATSITY